MTSHTNAHDRGYITAPEAKATERAGIRRFILINIGAVVYFVIMLAVTFAVPHDDSGYVWLVLALGFFALTMASAVVLVRGSKAARALQNEAGAQ